MLPTHQREQATAFIVGGVIVVRTPQGRQSKGSGDGGAWRGRSVEREESGEGGRGEGGVWRGRSLEKEGSEKGGVWRRRFC